MSHYTIANVTLYDCDLHVSRLTFTLVMFESVTWELCNRIMSRKIQTPFQKNLLFF